MTYQEQRYTLNGDVDEEKTKSAYIVGDVEHRSLDMTWLNLLVLTGAGLRYQALVRNSSFPLGQEPTLARSCWHEKRRGETDEYGEKAFEEEDVAPGVDDH